MASQEYYEFLRATSGASELRLVVNLHVELEGRFRSETSAAFFALILSSYNGLNKIIIKLYDKINKKLTRKNRVQKEISGNSLSLRDCDVP